MPDAQATATGTAAVVGYPLVDLARPAVAHDQDQGAQDHIDVGSLTICRLHGELIIGAPHGGTGTCPRCARDRRDQAKKEARDRPARVRVAAPGQKPPDDQTALLPVPADASPLLRHVAEAAASIATVHLQVGHSLHLALGHLALGRDQVTRHLDALGIAVDRKTSAALIEDLCRLKVIRWEGQLPSWHDRVGPAETFHKQGAFTYALNIVTHKLRRAARRGHRAHPSGSPATVRGVPITRRLQGCLEAAVELATVGIRNDLGHWLACRCTDEGLAEVETLRVMESYRARLPEKHSYSLVEMTATVRGRYRKLARLAA